MSDSTPTSLEPGEFRASDPIPEATPQPGEASASVERRRSRSGTEADASPVAPPHASAACGVPCNPHPELSTTVDSSTSITPVGDDLARLPPLARSRQRQRSLSVPTPKVASLQPEQRLLLLDTWQRSGLPAADFAALVGISKFSLFAWKKKFEQEGPAGLMDKPKGTPPGSRLPELTKRTILMLKQANPDWGCQKISDMLVRGPALPASASAVAKVLHEAGYVLEDLP